MQCGCRSGFPVLQLEATQRNELQQQLGCAVDVVEHGNAAASTAMLCYFWLLLGAALAPGTWVCAAPPLGRVECPMICRARVPAFVCASASVLTPACKRAGVALCMAAARRCQQPQVQQQCIVKCRSLTDVCRKGCRADVHETGVCKQARKKNELAKRAAAVSHIYVACSVPRQFRTYQCPQLLLLLPTTALPAGSCLSAAPGWRLAMCTFVHLHTCCCRFRAVCERLVCAFAASADYEEVVLPTGTVNLHVYSAGDWQVGAAAVEVLQAVLQLLPAVYKVCFLQLYTHTLLCIWWLLNNNRVNGDRTCRNMPALCWQCTSAKWYCTFMLTFLAVVDHPLVLLLLAQTCTVVPWGTS